MRIEAIRLRNFRSYADSILSLDRLNIVRGPNGAGKTALQMAIEFCLTGRCEATDQAGRGAEQLIRLGQESLVVELKMADGCTVSASRTFAGGSLIVTEMANNLSGNAARAALGQRYADVEVLASVLNAHRFLDFAPAQQKALLTGALRPEPIEISKETHDLLLRFLPLQSTTVRSTAEVDGVYERLYEMRTGRNRELKALKGLPAPEPLPKDMPTKEETEAKLAKLNEDRDAARAKVITTTVGYHSALKAWETEEAQRHTLEQRKSALDFEILEQAEIDRLSRVAGKAGEAAELDQEIEKQRTKVTAIGAHILEWRNAPTKCDKCGAALAMTQEEQDRKVAELETQAVPETKTLEGLQTKRRKMGDPAQAVSQLEAHKTAVVESAKLAETLKTMTAAKPAAIDTTSLDDEVRLLEERIRKGREILHQVVTLTAQAKAHANIAADRKRLEEEIDALERLVDMFGPKGSLKGRLVQGRLPEFVARMDSVLQRFGFTCTVELEPFAIWVTTAKLTGTAALRLEQLSESQRYRFGIAFQVALAEATGVGLVVIDRADMLQLDARRVLTQELLESRLDQAIVCATASGDQSMTPLEVMPADTGFFWLDYDGTTKVRAAGGRAEVTYVHD